MRKLSAAFGAVLVLATACMDNPVSPSRDQVVAGSPQSLQTLATGILGATRAATGTVAWDFLYGGIDARDVLRLDPNDNRFTQEFYVTTPDPSSFVGSASWQRYYIANRAIINLYDQPAFTTLAAGDQAITRGFFNTVKALNYIKVFETRDSLGIALMLKEPSALPPILCKPSALAGISALLDSAYADLTASGTSTDLPFTAAGFDLHGDYTTKDGIIRFNRGLKGKVEILRATSRQASTGTAGFTAALAALDIALAGAPASPDAAFLAEGPYYLFNSASPESFPNPLGGDTKIGLTDNFLNGYMAGDLRQANVYTVANPQQAQGYSFTKSYVYTKGDQLNRPMAMIRNAELYLLRAEAKLGLNDLPGATADVNAVHVGEGGLAKYADFTTRDQAIAALNYEYRYSLVLEGWQHLSLLRRYGLLTSAYVNQAGTPNGGAGDPLNSVLPIPVAEVTARNGATACQ
ncbi:MAG: RagB/SusD family nutrient uptake outer membrane protein [Gemmatimonadaceae bacterium]|nr:RagB/SusD family nutrient uptake outer membrane protein [Gemmatimonadaceae bacterium]NUQ94926.1 RagB/SusD family nutrient uptake outer membrane protein [Gemmatimonadaceae bacterium]NUR18699.1 RagB/SusD family nutrient uptake outer membrane protein [Gemmatimonadaceae bacterium]NUS97306.1 RagB/SusD family nutrient uptake outer membrane protein [Gemmatimonadaceae bacterium]